LVDRQWRDRTPLDGWVPGWVAHLLAVGTWELVNGCALLTVVIHHGGHTRVLLEQLYQINGPPFCNATGRQITRFYGQIAFGQATNQLLFNKKQKRQSSGTLAKKSRFVLDLSPTLEI
jgi:hypothetical protein